MQECQENTHCLLLIPGEHEGQRKLVHLAPKRLSQSHSHLDGTVGIVALAHVHDPRETADISKVQIVKAELSAC